MKKLLAAAVVIGLLAWVVSWFRTPQAVAASGALAWPAGLGPLDAAAAKFPPLQANAAARKLTALGEALPESEAVGDYVSREVSRRELTIGKPPALPDVSPIRELLLNEPVVWRRGEGMGDNDDTASKRALQMTVARALVAGALSKARANDPAAWEDLHAAWKLALTLDGYPQMMTQTAALSIARMVNGVAWKMPLPAPDWFAALQTHDNVGPLLEAFHYMAASYWQDGSQIFPTKWLALSVENDRRIAGELAGLTTCQVSPRANELGPDLTSVWRRAFRYRAEREATANALRLRDGKPLDPRSRCTDGTWTFDGTTLRFTRDIPTSPQDRPMPLELRLKP